MKKKTPIVWKHQHERRENQPKSILKGKKKPQKTENIFETLQNWTRTES